MRVADPTLIPAVPPNESTRKLVGDFGLALMESIPTARLVRTHLEAAASECFAGRWHGAIACLTDARIAVHDTIDAIGLSRLVGESIGLFDREHTAAMGPSYAYDRVRMAALSLRDMPLPVIRAHKAAHLKECRRAGCSALAAFNMAELRAMGGC